MKNVKQIRADLDRLAEETDNTDIRKLTTLVRAGLFDPHKLTMLKRALNKDNVKMTKAERETLLELLDKLLGLVTANQGIYTKVRQAVNEDIVVEDFEYSMARSELKSLIKDAENLLSMLKGEGDLEAWVQSKITKAADYIGSAANYMESGEADNDEEDIKEEYEEIEINEENANKLKKTSIDINQVPSIIIMKRKAIRVFPDGQKVALYWADRINKYISVPFQSIGISEETLNETSLERATAAYAARRAQSASNDDDDPNSVKYNFKAARTLRRVQKKFGKQTAAVTQSIGDKAAKKAQVEKEYNKNNTLGSIAKTSLGMAASGDIGGGLGTLVGAGLRSIIRGKRTTFESVYPPGGAFSYGKKGQPGTPTSRGLKGRFAARLKEVREYGVADAAADAASFIPGPAGSAASLASAGLSLSRGDYVGAGLDALGAIPLVGYAAKAAKIAKVARAASKVAGAAADANKVARAATDASKVAGIATDVSKVRDIKVPSSKPAKLPGSGNFKGKLGGEKPSGSGSYDPNAKPATSTPKTTTPKPETTTPKPETTTPKPGGEKPKRTRAERLAARAAKLGAAARLGTAFGGSGGSGGSGDSRYQGKGAAPAFGGHGINVTNPYAASRERKANINFASSMQEDSDKNTNKLVYKSKGAAPAFGGKSIGTSSSVHAYRERKANINFAAQQNENNNLNNIKMASESNESTIIEFDDGNIKLTSGVAKRIVEVYDSLNAKNKSVVEEMINTNKQSFTKVLEFSLRN